MLMGMAASGEEPITGAARVVLAVVIGLVFMAICLAVVTFAALWWVRRRRPEVERLVASDGADWAGYVWLADGARAFGGRRDRAIGILAVKDGELRWRPDHRARRRGSTDVARPLPEARVTFNAWQRQVTGPRYREVHIVFGGIDVVTAMVYAEAGVEPTAWLATGN